MCADMRTGIDTGTHTGMHTDMRTGTDRGMHTGMHTDMRTDTRLYMRLDIHLDVRRGMHACWVPGTLDNNYIGHNYIATGCRELWTITI